MFRFGKIDIRAFVSQDRRDFLKTLGLGAGFMLSDSMVSPHAWANPVFKADPFSLGIASGEPAADGFVIWTKLAPEPLALNSGMPARAVEVKWTLSTDEKMTGILRSGAARAKPELGHSVHVEITGLEPGREYFYRFEAGGVRSAIGRAKTFPAPGSTVPVRFASAGCQRYEDGYFTAWRRIAEDRLDFVAHYGDYIYEYKALKPGGDRRVDIIRDMPGAPGKCLTLADFRHRYALYKLDPDLQAAHASTSFLASFDDHEVENNWTGYSSAYEGTSRQAFALRKAAAFQAWYEHMPLRARQMPKGPDVLAYRRFRIGDLLQLDILDTRQYRDVQPCNDGWKVCPEAKENKRTMLGKQQEDWLNAGFRESRAKWNLLAQQVPMGRFDRNPDPTITETHMDKWDGAEAARNRLFAAVEAAKLTNLVVLAGDVHHNRAAELKADFDDPASRTVGVEFIATSISSNGDGSDQPKSVPNLMSANPQMKFYNNQRGYVRHQVSPERWQADFQVLDKVSVRDAPIRTRASFVVESGKPALSKL